MKKSQSFLETKFIVRNQKGSTCEDCCIKDQIIVKYDSIIKLLTKFNHNEENINDVEKIKILKNKQAKDKESIIPKEQSTQKVQNNNILENYLYPNNLQSLKKQINSIQKLPSFVLPSRQKNIKENHDLFYTRSNKIIKLEEQCLLNYEKNYSNKSDDLWIKSEGNNREIVRVNKREKEGKQNKQNMREQLNTNNRKKEQIQRYLCRCRSRQNQQNKQLIKQKKQQSERYVEAQRKSMQLIDDLTSEIMELKSVFMHVRQMIYNFILAIDLETQIKKHSKVQDMLLVMMNLFQFSEGEKEEMFLHKKIKRKKKAVQEGRGKEVIFVTIKEI